MSSERHNSRKSFLIRPSQVNLNMSLLPPTSTPRVFTTLTGVIGFLLLTYPHHLNLHSFILSDRLASPSSLTRKIKRQFYIMSRLHIIQFLKYMVQFYKKICYF
ncbi:hypothetical protein Hanom_Chr10g00943261 [Helianthus anomalus]